MALEAARSETAQARAEVEAAQARVAELESGRAAAAREAGGLLARIAELERPADGDLERRAREQTAATAAAARPADEARQRGLGQPRRRRGRAARSGTRAG